MQYAIARDEMNGSKSPHGARAAARGIATAILTLALLTATACSKSVSVTVDGESISFDEREQEALVRYGRCTSQARGQNALAMCAANAPLESGMEEDEAVGAWLDKTATYSRAAAAGGLGMGHVEDAELRSKLHEICGRLFAAETAWCTSNYGRTP